MMIQLVGFHSLFEDHLIWIIVILFYTLSKSRSHCSDCQRGFEFATAVARATQTATAADGTTLGHHRGAEEVFGVLKSTFRILSYLGLSQFDP